MLSVIRCPDCDGASKEGGKGERKAHWREKLGPIIGTFLRHNKLERFTLLDRSRLVLSFGVGQELC